MSLELFDGTSERMLTVFGAMTTSGQPTNNIWGTRDRGRTWSRLNSESMPWSSRVGHRIISTGSKNGLFLIGGKTSSETLLNDVWFLPSEHDPMSFRTNSWQLQTNNAQWSPREGHCLGSFDYGQTILVWSGRLSTASFDLALPSVAWISFDYGVNWSMRGAHEGIARRYAACAQYGERVVMVGGQLSESSTDISSSILTSTDRGLTWSSLVTSSVAPSPRYGAAFASGNWLLPNTPNDIYVTSSFGLSIPIRQWTSINVMILSGGIGVTNASDPTSRQARGLGDIWILNLSTFEWSQHASLEGTSRSRAYHALIPHLEGWYVLGGSTFIGEWTQSEQVSKIEHQNTGDTFYLQATCLAGARPTCHAIKDLSIGTTIDSSMNMSSNQRIGTGGIIGIVIGIIVGLVMMACFIRWYKLERMKPKPTVGS